jgi:hypothetical protein
LAAETTPFSDITTIADSCFAHLVGDPELLNKFMNLAGYTPDSIRKSIGTDSLNRAMMDFFASNESALMSMCETAGLSAERFMHVWNRINATG